MPHSPAITFIKAYIKNLSIEVPHFSSLPNTLNSPDINIKLRAENTKIDDYHYEFTVNFTLTGVLNQQTIFLIEMTQAGFFHFDTQVDSEIQHALNHTCPNILFPFARMNLAALVIYAGFQPVVLSHIQFDLPPSFSVPSTLAEKETGTLDTVKSITDPITRTQSPSVSTALPDSQLETTAPTTRPAMANETQFQKNKTDDTTNLADSDKPIAQTLDGDSVEAEAASPAQPHPILPQLALNRGDPTALNDRGLNQQRTSIKQQKSPTQLVAPSATIPPNTIPSNHYSTRFVSLLAMTLLLFTIAYLVQKHLADTTTPNTAFKSPPKLSIPMQTAPHPNNIQQAALPNMMVMAKAIDESTQRVAEQAPNSYTLVLATQQTADELSAWNALPWMRPLNLTQDKNGHYMILYGVFKTQQDAKIAENELPEHLRTTAKIRLISKLLD